MTEARDIEGIVAEWERNMRLQDGKTTMLAVWHSDARAIVADWRAKKAEIERLKMSRELVEKEIDALSASHKDLAHRLALASPARELPSNAPSP